ncbi:MAG: hypothetical protein MJZ25_15015 [Fibrobacter sp.]|nr:hypothetical protein [Fibrobacter sp.]
MKFVLGIKFAVGVVALGLMLGLFAGCGNDPSSSSRGDECPEGYICDTTYTDTSAYSFVYYSGKNKLDTVTAFTGEMKCDIEDNYFSCRLTRTYKTCYVVYSAQANHAERNTDSDSLIHKEINILRVDTTFINYGKKRLIDFIPPYIEQEKMDLKGLQDAFDTIELDFDDSYTYDKYRGRANFRTPYVMEDVYGTLPSDAGLLTYPSYYTVGADGDSIWHVNLLDLESIGGCYETIRIDYPFTPKIHEVGLYIYSDEPLEKDTTVTWQAYYTDMYGVRDSTEITTVFRMKDGFSKPGKPALEEVPDIDFCEDFVPKTCDFSVNDSLWFYCGVTPKDMAGGHVAEYYYYSFNGAQVVKRSINENLTLASDESECENFLSHGAPAGNVYCKGPVVVTVKQDTLSVANDETRKTLYENAKSHCEEVREHFDKLYESRE